MNKCFKKNALMLACLLSLSLIGLRTYGQSDRLSIISQKLIDSRNLYSSEKLFLHSDKSFYLAGELIWFKVYVVDGINHHPSKINKLSYVELLDSKGKAVDQAMIALDKGLGNGSFQLSSSLNSGEYVLRAYTNLMKNGDEDFFYEKRVIIVNTLKSAETATTLKTDYDIQFFAEGGNFIAGVKNKVAYKVVDSNGKGVGFSGRITDGHSNVVIDGFRPLKDGMGSVSFTPVENEKYSAELRIGNEVITKELPVVQSRGYSMFLTESNDVLAITVSAKNVYDEGAISLIAHTRMDVKIKESKSLSNGSVVFNLPVSMLGEGISHITIFDQNQRPVSERLYFKQPEHYLSLSATTDNSLYQSRQRVAVNISSLSERNKPQNANLSMAVFKADSLQHIDAANIVNYLWLSSDLKGKIESPDYYFSSNSTEVKEAADNLMLTQGWRRFEWKTVLNSKSPTITNLPEYEGHLVRGVVLNKQTGAPGSDITVYLSSPGKFFRVAVAKSDAQGKLLFNIGDLIGSEELIVQAVDENYRVEIESPFIEKSNAYALPSVNTHIERFQSQLLDRSISTQVQQAFTNEKQLKFSLPAKVDTSLFYGQPEKSYFLDDFTRFRTFEEVLREYVSEVSISRQQKGYQFNMTNSNFEMLPKNPLVLIDGVPFFKTDSVVAINPMKIKKLEAINRMFSFGYLTLNGIISLSTYKYDLEGIPLDPNALIVEYEGLQLQRQFYSPVYETSASLNSRVPDFRNVLYWNPTIITGSNGNASLQFYTGDEQGEYKIVVQGITAEGRAGYKVVDFKVQNDLVKK
ncbi:hypothetical protein [Solitalea canadensis]|nr:hypothetical protein [Solitalea canadensis]